MKKFPKIAAVISGLISLFCIIVAVIYSGDVSQAETYKEYDMINYEGKLYEKNTLLSELKSNRNTAIIVSIIFLIITVLLIVYIINKKKKAALAGAGNGMASTMGTSAGFCMKCGNARSGNEQFCSKCGNKF